MSLFRINFIILLAVLLLIWSKGFSQEKEILSGKIITEESLNSPVHIINISRKKGGVSELSGRFSIEVSVGDTLVFSSVQYKKEKIVVNREILQLKNYRIKLIEDLTELEEVKLHKLSGNLAKDISGIETFNKFDLNATMARKPPPTQLERQTYTATTGPGGGIPLDPILNKLNGTLDKLEKRKENADLKFQVEQAVYLISEKTFTIDFEIPESEIMNFAYYCAENYDLENLLDNLLELYEFFQSKAEDYKALKVLD
ncbi:hypothetical protein SAMN05660776_2383 [Salegentibacter holothuriorum]|uniref:CarboxypepD_reg-like domain-containing protein n=1 Tax=Salegentibacter holothuriorum TaxID=241145 RepID=A0A1T5D4F6_9FLAO|nr:hypothetical protein [Salegentibacter holothuriorum]SKB66575.1 hypothetical protein SAMN05660776_2383 [Salegentibacter holothuriorum]